MNKIEIYFTPCTPEALGGYSIYFRVAGSGSEYINGGVFFISPAIFYDTLNPAGTCYEGFITANCGGGVLGNAIAWNGCGSVDSGGSGGGGGGQQCLSYTVQANTGGATIEWVDCESGTQLSRFIPQGDQFTLCTREQDGYFTSFGSVTVVQENGNCIN